MTNIQSILVIENLKSENTFLKRSIIILSGLVAIMLGMILRFYGV